MIGSDVELTFDLEHLRAGFAQPGVADELERAYVHSPYDVLARVLLRDRAEVLHYTQIETREVGGRMQAQPASTNQGACAAPGCVRAAAAINTDDNALIEFAAPRDLIGFERYKGYLQTIYADTWPYGSLAGRVRGFTPPPAAAEEHAELALALLAHGRAREASRLLAEAGSVTEATRFAQAMSPRSGRSRSSRSPRCGRRARIRKSASARIAACSTGTRK